VAHAQDLATKLARALAVRGPRFLNLTCPCVPGWGVDDDASLALLRLGVESRAVPLYEIEDGTRYRVTHWPAGIPVAEYLRPQARYAHLDEAGVAEIQADVDRRWVALVERAGRSRAPDRRSGRHALHAT
jgi:pyruvate/2-oxoacid:ferredoxin oxidoreductase beta subunit